MHPWGHALPCACAVCFCLKRVFRVISEGSRLDGFVEAVGPRLLILEGEVRDLAERFILQGRPVSPNLVNIQPVQPPAGKGAEQPPQTGGTASTSQSVKGGESGPKEHSQASEGSKVAPAPLQLATKAKPPEPPLPPPHCRVKESDQDPKIVLDVVETEEVPSPKAAESSKPRAEKDPSKRRKKSRSRERRKSKRRSRSRSRRRRREESRGEKNSPRSPVGCDRKKRRSSTPRRRSIPLPRTPERPRQPRSPSRPPPGYHYGSERGPGWIGPLPYSNHPRWQGENKGQVKRAKQERFNRRHGRR